MIPFLDLKGLNAQYRAELIDACTKVIDSGWYIQGNECQEFEKEFAQYCGTKYAIGVANGLDALILILRAYKELGIMNDGDVVADFDSDLVGEGAHSEVKVVAISSGRQTQGIDTRVTNKAPHSVGHILQHGVIRDRGTLTFNGIGHILKGAKGADAQQESRVLMLSDKARGDANPILLIDEFEVTAGHAASAGRLDPDELYYLMSRGLPQKEAERLVTRGFLGSVITSIPVKAVQKEFVEVIDRKLAD